MVKDHTSPEERLLSLIRGKHKKPQPQGAPDAPRPKDHPQGAMPKPTSEKISGLHVGELFRPSHFKYVLFEPAALKALNRYLVILAALFGLYLFIDILFVRPDKEAASQIAKDAGSSGQALPESIRKEGQGVRDYSFYSAEISNKNIFGKAESEEGSSQQVMAPPEDMAQALGLVGVIAGDNPQAVIEDKKAQKTYYLIKGQSFNGLTVEEISEGKVVLEYQGKKIALLL